MFENIRQSIDVCIKRRKKCQISMNMSVYITSIIEMFNKRTDYDMEIIK